MLQFDGKVLDVIEEVNHKLDASLHVRIGIKTCRNIVTGILETEKMFS
jgi:hypothetical protein